MPDLFDAHLDASPETRPPLAERMRPDTLDEFAGQEHLLGPDGALRRAIEGDVVPSMVFWGPPGTGKTTLAHIIAQMTGSVFMAMSAVSVGIKDVKLVIDDARDRLKMYKRRTILFLDEIHRFNKSQQDAFLPHVENGTLTLIGATTENPSFEINSALLSRMRVFVLRELAPEHIRQIVLRALAKSNGPVNTIDDDALEFISLMSAGDARFALNTLEFACSLAKGQSNLTKKSIEEAMQKKAILYDRAGEEHFNTISALHKSVRGSDPQAALYFFYRMVEGGEDPMYLARRIIRMATEDIGLADPSALTLCISAKDAYHHLGKPEGVLALAEAVVYLALAPKSNRLYTAAKAVQSEIETTGPLPVPNVIRNAPTKLMKELDYGKGYQYDHDEKESFSGQDYFPGGVRNRSYYSPGKYGFEAELTRRMEHLKKLKEEKKKEPS
ncbi:MAG: replication-associated recombination protein A [Fibrobacterota bacterium]